MWLRSLIVLILLFSLISPTPSFAKMDEILSPSEEVKRKRFNVFTNTIIYGIFAGSAVGLAMSTDFQFVLDVELNLRHVARGASYGFYAGLLLGAYISYMNIEDPPDEEYEESLDNEEEATSENFSFYMTPLFKDGRAQGVHVGATLLRF